MLGIYLLAFNRPRITPTVPYQNYCNIIISLRMSLFLPFSHFSPGWRGGAGPPGHHVLSDLSWPRPRVPVVPWRVGGVGGGGNRRGQREGVRQRQCCGKLPGVWLSRGSHQTLGQGRHTGRALFLWGQVSTVRAFLTFVLSPVMSL